MIIQRKLLTALALGLTAGCAGDAATNGEEELAPGAVRFSLVKGPQIPIRVVLPEIAKVDVVVKDHQGSNVLAVTQVAYPRWPYWYFYGLCGDDCSQLPRGSYANLPEGDYTVEAVQTAPHGRRLQCTFVPPTATHRVTLLGNLDAAAPTTLFDPASPETTSDFLISVEISDSLGYDIPLDIFFGRRLGTDACGGGTWTYHVLADGADLAVEGDGKTPARSGRSTEVAAGKLCFGLQGELVAETRSDELSFIPRHAAEPQSLRFSFGVSRDTAEGSTGFTQQPSSSYVFVADNDGNTPLIDCTVGDSATPVDSTAAATAATAPVSASIRTVIDVRPIHTIPYGYSLPTHRLAALACVCGELGTSGTDTPSLVFPPGKSPTSSIRLRGNLDQTAMPAAPFDPTNAEETSNLKTTMTVNDSLGNAVSLGLYFSKLDAQNTQAGDSGDWTYHVFVGSDPALRTIVAVGRLRFDEAGRLISNETTLNTTVDAGLEAITFDFGNETASGGDGFGGLNQYAASSAISDAELVGAYPESCRLYGADTTGFVCWETSWPE